MSRKNKKKIPEGSETPFCPHFELCGGCTYQKFTYEGQKNEKLNKVRDMLNEVYPDFPLYECISSPKEKEYRNKMEFSFGDEEKDGPLTLGLHRRGSFYSVVPIYDCHLVDSDYRAILWSVMQFFREIGVPYVHKKTHEGVLRHLLIRKSEATKEILVGLVTSSEADNAGWLKDFVDRITILDLNGHIFGIIQIINDSLADVVQADKTVILYGKDTFEEKLFDLSFTITPFSFFQTNSTGAAALYDIVRDYIGDVSGLKVYDLYSGTGTIAQILATVAEDVTGVEIVEEAVESARLNAEKNGLSNCRFIAGDVLSVLDELTDPPDVMVLDPPREGIHPKALPKLLSYGVSRFVYVSCKPQSLARDLVSILEAGYKPVKSVCVDMFPWTKHIETVVLFEK